MYYVISNKDPKLVISYTQNSGSIFLSTKKVPECAGWQIEDAGEGAFFLTHGKYVLSVNPNTGAIITLTNRLRNGWGGWVFEDLKPKPVPVKINGGVFFLEANSNPENAIAVADDQTIYSSKNREIDGFEG